jgi:hypothetical protein
VVVRERQVGGENGVYTVYMSYDDVDRRLRGLRGDLRTCPFSVYAEVVQADGFTNAGRKAFGTFVPGTNVTVPIATTTAARIVLTLRADGRLDGVAKNIEPLARVV